MNYTRLVIGAMLLFGQHRNILLGQCTNAVVNMNYVTSTGGTGTYADPATGSIEFGFCLTLNGFFEKSTNWVHGIFVSWADIQPGVIITQGLTGAQPTQHGSRTWIWVDSLKARQLDLPGIGYFVDDGDGNPKTNYGDNGLGTPNATFPSLSPFCFVAKFTCGSATLLRGVVTVTGDGTTGAWKNPACSGDPIKATTGGPNGDGTLVVCGLILPLDLLSFEGYSKDGINYLSWSGIGDEKFSHYTLERRAENTSSFAEMQQFNLEPGKENNVHYMAYRDETPDPINYYRLKMVEKDNTFTYSKVISVKAGGIRLEHPIDVFPNPAVDVVFVQFPSGNAPATYQLEIMNLNGYLVFEKIYQFKGATSQQSINLEQLEHGVYFVRITGGDIAQPEIFRLLKKS